MSRFWWLAFRWRIVACRRSLGPLLGQQRQRIVDRRRPALLLERGKHRLLIAGREPELLDHASIERKLAEFAVPAGQVGTKRDFRRVRGLLTANPLPVRARNQRPRLGDHRNADRCRRRHSCRAGNVAPRSRNVTYPCKTSHRRSLLSTPRSTRCSSGRENSQGSIFRSRAQAKAFHKAASTARALSGTCVRSCVFMQHLAKSSMPAAERQRPSWQPCVDGRQTPAIRKGHQHNRHCSLLCKAFQRFCWHKQKIIVPCLNFFQKQKRQQPARRMRRLPTNASCWERVA